LDAKHKVYVAIILKCRFFIFN